MELTPRKKHRDEEGFVLVAALACLVALTMIGLSLMTSSNMEKEIAHNLNINEKVFYGADGTTETGIEMIEKNVACPEGWHWARPAGLMAPDNSVPHNGMDVFDIMLAHRKKLRDIPWSITIPVGNRDLSLAPSDLARSMRIPDNYLIPSGPARDVAPHANIAIFGTAGWGGPIGSVKDGDNVGKVKEYNIWVQNLGIFDSETIIRLGYTHIMRDNPECQPF